MKNLWYYVTFYVLNIFPFKLYSYPIFSLTYTHHLYFYPFTFSLSVASYFMFISYKNITRSLVTSIFYLVQVHWRVELVLLCFLLSTCHTFQIYFLYYYYYFFDWESLLIYLFAYLFYFPQPLLFWNIYTFTYFLFIIQFNEV